MDRTMSDTADMLFKSEHYSSSLESEPPMKKQRTSEDFFSFCKFILEYENYEAMKQEELRQKNNSPVGSSGSSVESLSSDSHGSPPPPLPKNIKQKDIESDEDSWDLITCFCMKPFAGRPMIECSECLTWIHLSCAKIRRNNIPEEFTCQRCKEAKLTTRRSQRIRGERRRLSA